MKKINRIMTNICSDNLAESRDFYTKLFDFNGEKLVILLNGFTKKTQKTPKKEIDKAIRLRESYYQEKWRK